MIPKTIHYCWFGRNPLPESAKKCIESWRKYCPGYSIKEWNEDNFDVNIIDYTRDAYRAKKYAFVSDYARFWILYHEGGLYFDTDVEIIRPIDDIVARGAFMGFEFGSRQLEPAINPGLGIGVEAGNAVYKEILKRYETMAFYTNDGKQNAYTMIPMVTQMMKEKGLQLIDQVQTVAGITFYTNDYFNPFDDATGRLNKTNNTRSIHWYAKTWTEDSKWKIVLKRWIRRVIDFIRR